MNQQLVISKSIIDYLVDKLPVFRKNEAIDLIEYIEQNFFVSDINTKHLNCLLDKIDCIESSQKKDEIKRIISYWIQEKKFFVNYEYEPENENEIALADHTFDKIYLQPQLTEKEIKKYTLKFNGIETHNSNSFINPQVHHRLKHLPTTIPLEKEVSYDLIKIFSPFIRNSRNVRIEDPYLPNLLASQNVLKLIKNFPEINIDLVFLTRALYSENRSEKEKLKKNGQYDSFIESLLKLIANGYKISYKNQFKTKKHRERFIFTDNFQIYIPGGFDFLNNDGYIVDNDLDISDKREIRIEKRKFELILTS